MEEQFVLQNPEEVSSDGQQGLMLKQPNYHG